MPVLRDLPVGGEGCLWDERVDQGVVRFRGRTLTIAVPRSSGVLFPTDGGLSLLAALDGNESMPMGGPAALDIGCGSGLYTLAMLAAGADRVTALDVNPAAAAVVRANAERNGFDPAAVECVTADLADFRPGRTYRVIMSNPPHLPHGSGDPALARRPDWTALVGGPRGRELFDTIVNRAADLLDPEGVLYLAHSSLCGVPETVDRMARLGFGHRVLGLLELDIPWRALDSVASSIRAELSKLREAGVADFDSNRFRQYAVAFSRSERVLYGDGY
ncbi:methyltransferase [Nocardia blacklockiae]|uniref:methyltransferase n=1 Tax=Nocardia blacklockiae TaxID=480036 RepID=UPI001894D187|nr:methyltransferase [Nocardia blacklockiae]MBF6170709.1 methyltransferase [Nocardia blacklockiae]